MFSKQINNLESLVLTTDEFSIDFTIKSIIDIDTREDLPIQTFTFQIFTGYIENDIPVPVNLQYEGDLTSAVKYKWIDLVPQICTEDGLQRLFIPFNEIVIISMKP